MREIRLTNGGVAIVDDEDFAHLSRWSWHRDRSGYARRGGTYRVSMMHRLVSAAEKGVEVDHVNGNPLDNRRENLRFATRGENARNVGPLPFRKHGLPYKGISKSRDGWGAFISIHKRQIYLGRFPTPEEAAAAYDRAAMSMFGAFARLNFPAKETA